jgi:hypothetical protein
MSESIEDNVWREFQAFVRPVEKFSRDAWINLPVRKRLKTFVESLEAAWVAFEQSRPDRATDDNGPTPADIAKFVDLLAGEVQNDVV